MSEQIKPTLRVVHALGSGSTLMEGDPDREDIVNTALPTLLAQGWTIDSVVPCDKGAYFIMKRSAAEAT